MKQRSDEEIKNGKKWRFVKRTAVIFAILLLALTALNLSPLPIRELNNSFFSLFINDERDKAVPEVTTDAYMEGVYTEPVRISIAKIGVDVKVLNPANPDIKVLDEALLYGAVRYPNSGDLESRQNMFIFGHSSYLPVVYNQNFKAFNRIQELKVGDEIKLYSSNAHEYLYKVSEVKLTTAEAELVDLSSFDHKLILSTCNSFGKKQERYVVTADFVGSYPLQK
ncbi:MAG: sortase [bacterium]|nr:sortase [bacterium]